MKNQESLCWMVRCVLLVLFVSACTAAPEATPTAVPPTKTPLATATDTPPPASTVSGDAAVTLTTALAKTKSASSYRFDFDANLKENGKESPYLDLAGERSGSNFHATSKTFNLVYLLPLNTGLGGFELQVVGGKGYAQVFQSPGLEAGKWYEMPAGQNLQPLVEGPMNIFQVSASDLKGASKIGTEMLDGMRCEVFGRNRDAAINLLVAFLGGMMRSPSESERSEFEVANTRFYVCDGYLRQIDLAVAAYPKTGKTWHVDFNARLRVYDFNQEIAITAPGEIFPLPPTPPPATREAQLAATATAWATEYAPTPAPTTPPKYPFAIQSARFSPDGKQIITASYDQTARVWDTATGRAVLVLRGHTDYVNRALFSPDGKQLVTTSGDKTTRIWDATTGKELGVLRREAGYAGALAWGPDGKQILVASGDETTVWDATTASKVRDLKGGEDATYSPDGRRIATNDFENVYIWDASTGSQLCLLSGHSEAIWEERFSPDSEKIVTVSKDKTAHIWDAATGKELAVLRGHTDQVWSAAFSPDGKQVVTGSDDHTARVWDAEAGKQMLLLQGHAKDLSGVTYSPDGKEILTWSNGEGAARVWDAKTGRAVSVLKAGENLLRDAAYSPDSRRIVTAHTDGAVHVWDAATGRELLVLRTPEAASAAPTATLTLTPAGTPAATAPAAQATATAQAAKPLLQTSSSWRAVLSDPFDENKNGWETSSYYGNTFKTSESITGGKYQWNVEANHSPALDWELPKMADVSDFAASVEARQISGTPNGRYGLIFRWMSGQNFYLFDIADDGTFKVSQATKEDPAKPLLSGKTSAIKPDEVNQMTVIGQGPHSTFFVDGQYVGELEEASWTNGSVGVAVELLNQGDEVVVEFDNLEVRAP